MPPRKEHPAWKFTTAGEKAMPGGRKEADSSKSGPHSHEFVAIMTEVGSIKPLLKLY